jgi:hypothetical protein
MLVNVLVCVCVCIYIYIFVFFSYCFDIELGNVCKVMLVYNDPDMSRKVHSNTIMELRETDFSPHVSYLIPLFSL